MSNLSILQNRYYDTKDSLNFAPLNRIKKELKNIKPEEISSWLMGQAASTMYKPRRLRFLTRKNKKKVCLRPYP